MKPTPKQPQTVISQLYGVFFRCELNNGIYYLKNISQNCLALFGYTREELLNNFTQSFFEFIHPHDYNRVHGEHMIKSPNESEYQSEYNIIDKNGLVKQIKEVSKVYPDNNGQKYIEGYLMETSSDSQFSEILKTLIAYQEAVNLSAIVSLTDKNGQILFANEKFIEVSKYSKNELVGNNHNILKSGYHDSAFYKNMWETILSGKPWRGEIKNKAKDGSFYWVDTVITPITNKENKITQYLSIRNIITTQKEQENILRTSEKKYRDIVENISDMIQSVDKNGIILFVNESWAKKLGYRAEEVIGKNIFQYIHPNCISYCEAIFQQIIQGKEFNGVDIVFKNIQGEKVICQANITAEFVGGVFNITRGIFRDVTESRKQQQELIRQQLQLKEAQKQAKLGSWFMDLKNNITEWSDETYRTFELPPVSPPSYKEFLNLVHVDDRQLVDTAWQNALKGQRYDIEYRIKVNGKIKWIRTFADVVLNEKKEPIYCLGNQQDITTVKLVELELREKQQLLNEAQKIAKVGSYEWNTITNEVKGSLEFFNILGLKETSATANFNDLFIKVHPDDKVQVMEQIGLAIQHKAPLSIQLRLLFPDNSVKYIEAKRHRPSTPEDSNYFFGTIQDISHFIQAEQHLFNSIIETEEKERERIAKELHDGVCQYLVTGKLLLSRISSLIDYNQLPMKELIDDCAHIFNKSLEMTRQLSHQLIPQDLYESGLISSIKEFIRMLNKITPNRFELIIIGNPKEPNPNISVNLFRIIQEFTQNSQKYSEASKIIIQISYTENTLELLLSDNGKGFDVSNLKTNKGIGLMNMIKRIQSIGGKYYFHTEPGVGVSIRIITLFNQ